MMSLLTLFCQVDDFWQAFRPIWHEHLLSTGERQRLRPTQLSESEIMTILIHFHQSGYRTFKDYYTRHVQQYLTGEFPQLVSYERFVKLIPRVGIALYVYLHLLMGRCTGISFVDSTPLRVCHNKRINRHRVFDGFAKRGKTTMGWFFGFKLHLVINHQGELIDFDLTPGNVDDREPLDDFASNLFGKLFGDKGYLSHKLAAVLREKGIALVTSIRRNMPPQILLLEDKLWLRKRAVIESINNLLKNHIQIEHSRHRSVDNFFVHLIAGLAAYCHRPDKPVVQLPADHLNRLSAAVA